MMKSDNQKARRKKEDLVLNRLLLWFTGALIAEAILLLVNRYCINYRASEIQLAAMLLRHVVPVGAWVGLALCVGALIWAAVRFKNGGELTLPLVAAFVTGITGACCVLLPLFERSSMKLLQAAVPVAVVLLLIYYLYQREFFLITVVGSLGILGLWIYRRGYPLHQSVVYLYAACLAVALLAVALLATRLKRKNGVLTLAGRQIPLLQKDTPYPLIYASCLLSLACMAAALLLGGTVAYYAIFALVAWIFAMAVYFTVKLL